MEQCESNYSGGRGKTLSEKIKRTEEIIGILKKIKGDNRVHLAQGFKRIRLRMYVCFFEGGTNVYSQEASTWGSPNIGLPNKNFLLKVKHCLCCPRRTT